MTGALATVREARARGLRPDTQLTVSQWADARRLLPAKSSAEPGPWRTDRTPFLREIMDCLSVTSDVEEVVFMKPAQIGGTEVILNWLGYIIDHSPAPTILVQPTVDLGKRFSRQRVDPLVTITPQIAQKVRPSRSRDSGNTLLSKDFTGGQLVITGANSAVGLRSMPAQNAALDEVDAYPIDIDEEGSPIDLVEARQRTFARRKRIKVSTPTIEGLSAIAAAYAESDQRRYFVPCPHCGETQHLQFAQLTWTRLGLPPERAVYLCAGCNKAIREHHKAAMLAAGEWRPQAVSTNSKVRGYHLNALYAPLGWMSWGDIATKFVAVHRKPERYRTFVNTVLAEPWQERGEVPEWRRLYDRRETYKTGSCPIGVLFLTAGVDVQKDRIIYEVVGWGREKESWSIEVGVFAGDTSRPEPWQELDGLLGRSFPTHTEVELRITRLAVDAGDQGQVVYNWTRRHSMADVIAVRGDATAKLIVGQPRPVDVTVSGRKLKRGAKYWPVGVNIVKSELYGWLNLEAPTQEAILAGAGYPPGYCHFPEHDESFFLQLTGEQLVKKKTKRGFTTLAWVPILGRENHHLDTRVYARAAASLVGIDRFREREWRAFENAIWVGAGRTPKAAVQSPPASPGGPPPAAPAGDQPPVAREPRKQRWLQPRRGWIRRN